MDLPKSPKKNKTVFKRGAIMRNKDLKMLIKKSALETMPDVFDKIDLDLVMDDYVERPLPRRVHHYSFTQVIKFASVILLLGITSIFVYNQIQNPSVEVMAMDTDAELIGFPAISGATLLDELSLTDLSQTIALPVDMMPQTTLIEEELSQFNRYMVAMETMIGEKDGLTYTIQDLTNQQYTKQIVYSTTDLLGNQLEYRFEYNMELLENETNEYRLEGVISIGENEYQLEGFLTQNDKVSQVRWKVMLDENTYVRIEDNSSSTKQQFRYLTYEDGVLTNSVQMQLLLVNNKVLGRLEVTSDGADIVYQINRNRNLNSPDTVAIQYNYNKGSNTEDGDILVDIEEVTEGQYQYRYQIKLMGSDTFNSEFRAPRESFTNKDSNPGNNHSPNSGNEDTPGQGNDHGKGRQIITNQV